MRCSAAVTAYLHPALGRENLTVIPHAHVQRLTFDGVRCTGASIAVRARSRPSRPAARSSSAAGRSTRRNCCSSPVSDQGSNWSRSGIDVVADLPGVGQNLQDHLMAPVAYRLHPADHPGRGDDRG